MAAGACAALALTALVLLVLPADGPRYGTGDALRGVLAGPREHIVTSREEERRRLRHDLHDDLGPGLAATACSSRRWPTSSAATGPGRRTCCTRPRATCAAPSPTSAGSSTTCGPAALDDLGLVPALDELTERLRSAGVDVTVEADGSLAGLSAAAEVAAYRITAEALANVAKHSGARRVRVHLSRDPTGVTVRVSDDGLGLPQQASAGVGITSMHQRAAELGGTCAVQGGPDGTTVVARLPAEQPA